MGVALAGALALAPVVAVAQQAPASSAPSAPDSVGPGSLQNFSLSGTVTRPADQTAPQPAPKKPQPKAEAQPDVSTAPPPPSKTRIATAPHPTPAAVAHPRPAPQLQRTTEEVAQQPPSSTVTVALPKLDSPPASVATAPAGSGAPTFAPPPSSTGTLAPSHDFALFPWLLAALVLGAGGAFLFWRNRVGQAVPAGPLFDLFAPLHPAPEAEAKPVTAPPPPVPASKPGPPPAAPVSKPAPRASARVVSSLRPWVEIGFQPLRCILEEQLVRVEFEIELFNSGSSPARAVLAEASLVNAGPTQDEQIAAFFAKPAGPGERLAVIPPLKRVVLKNQVFVPRDQLQAFELAGRALFVPLIAFNVYYQWSGGDAQTSVSYLLGRETKGEKLAPFRADLGPRIFRGLAARPLPASVRN